MQEYILSKAEVNLQDTKKKSWRRIKTLLFEIINCINMQLYIQNSGSHVDSVIHLF